MLRLVIVLSYLCYLSYVVGKTKIDRHDESDNYDNKEAFYKTKRYNLNNDLPDMEDDIYNDFSHQNFNGSPNIDGAPNVEVPSTDVRSFAFSNDAFTDRLISSLQSVDSVIQDKVLGTINLSHKNKEQNGGSTPSNANSDPSEDHTTPYENIGGDEKAAFSRRKIGDAENRRESYEENGSNDNVVNSHIKQSDQDVQGTKKDQYELHRDDDSDKKTDQSNFKYLMKSKDRDENHNFFKSANGFDEYRTYPNEYTEVDDSKSSRDDNEYVTAEKETQGYAKPISDDKLEQPRKMESDEHVIADVDGLHDRNESGNDVTKEEKRERQDDDDDDLEKETSELLNINVQADGKIVDGNNKHQVSKESIFDKENLEPYIQSFNTTKNSSQIHHSHDEAESLLKDIDNLKRNLRSSLQVSNAMIKHKNRKVPLPTREMNTTAESSSRCTNSLNLSTRALLTSSTSLRMCQDARKYVYKVKHSDEKNTNNLNQFKDITIKDEMEKEPDGEEIDTMELNKDPANKSTSKIGSTNQINKLFSHKSHRRNGKKKNDRTIYHKQKKYKNQERSVKRHTMYEKRNKYTRSKRLPLMRQKNLEKSAKKRDYVAENPHHFAGAISYTDTDGREMTFTIGRDAVKYSDARQICQERNGDLTSIKDEDEQNFIANTVIPEPDDYWIGLDDTWSEGDFEWVDGTPLHYTNWSAQEPDNGKYNTNAEHDEDCTVIKSTFDWSDVGCLLKFKFICRIPHYNITRKPIHQNGMIMTKLTENGKHEALVSDPPGKKDGTSISQVATQKTAEQVTTTTTNVHADVDQTTSPKNLLEVKKVRPGGNGGETVSREGTVKDILGRNDAEPLRYRSKSFYEREKEGTTVVRSPNDPVVKKVSDILSSVVSDLTPSENSRSAPSIEESRIADTKDSFSKEVQQSDNFESKGFPKVFSEKGHVSEPEQVTHPPFNLAKSLAENIAPNIIQEYSNRFSGDISIVRDICGKTCGETASRMAFGDPTELGEVCGKSCAKSLVSLNPNEFQKVVNHFYSHNSDQDKNDDVKRQKFAEQTMALIMEKNPIKGAQEDRKVQSQEIEADDKNTIHGSTKHQEETTEPPKIGTSSNQYSQEWKNRSEREPVGYDKNLRVKNEDDCNQGKRGSCENPKLETEGEENHWDRTKSGDSHDHDTTGMYKNEHETKNGDVHGNGMGDGDEQGNKIWHNNDHGPEKSNGEKQIHDVEYGYQSGHEMRVGDKQEQEKKENGYERISTEEHTNEKLPGIEHGHRIKNENEHGNEMKTWSEYDHGIRTEDEHRLMILNGEKHNHEKMDTEEHEHDLINKDQHEKKLEEEHGHETMNEDERRHEKNGGYEYDHGAADRDEHVDEMKGRGESGHEKVAAGEEHETRTVDEHSHELMNGDKNGHEVRDENDHGKIAESEHSHGMSGGDEHEYEMKVGFHGNEITDGNVQGRNLNNGDEHSHVMMDGEKDSHESMTGDKQVYEERDGDKRRHELTGKDDHANERMSEDEHSSKTKSDENVHEITEGYKHDHELDSEDNHDKRGDDKHGLEESGHEIIDRDDYRHGSQYGQDSDHKMTKEYEHGQEIGEREKDRYPSDYRGKDEHNNEGDGQKMRNEDYHNVIDRDNQMYDREHKEKDHKQAEIYGFSHDSHGDEKYHNDAKNGGDVQEHDYVHDNQHHGERTAETTHDMYHDDIGKHRYDENEHRKEENDKHTECAHDRDSCYSISKEDQHHQVDQHGIGYENNAVSLQTHIQGTESGQILPLGFFPTSGDNNIGSYHGINDCCHISTPILSDVGDYNQWPDMQRNGHSSRVDCCHINHPLLQEGKHSNEAHHIFERPTNYHTETRKPVYSKEVPYHEVHSSEYSHTQPQSSSPFKTVHDECKESEPPHGSACAASTEHTSYNHNKGPTSDENCESSCDQYCEEKGKSCYHDSTKNEDQAVSVTVHTKPDEHHPHEEVEMHTPDAHSQEVYHHHEGQRLANNDMQLNDDEQLIDGNSHFHHPAVPIGKIGPGSQQGFPFNTKSDSGSDFHRVPAMVQQYYHQPLALDESHFGINEHTTAANTAVHAAPPENTYDYQHSAPANDHENTAYTHHEGSIRAHQNTHSSYIDHFQRPIESDSIHETTVSLPSHLSINAHPLQNDVNRFESLVNSKQIPVTVGVPWIPQVNPAVHGIMYAGGGPINEPLNAYEGLRGDYNDLRKIHQNEKDYGTFSGIQRNTVELSVIKQNHGKRNTYNGNINAFTKSVINPTELKKNNKLRINDHHKTKQYKKALEKDLDTYKHKKLKWLQTKLKHYKNYLKEVNEKPASEEPFNNSPFAANLQNVATPDFPQNVQIMSTTTLSDPTGGSYDSNQFGVLKRNIPGDVTIAGNLPTISKLIK